MKKTDKNSSKGISRRRALYQIGLGTTAIGAAPFAFGSKIFAGNAKSNSITLAMVGGAHIHAPNFANRMSRTDFVQTKYVWDPSSETARERQQVTGGDIVDDPNIIFNDPDVDGVIITSQTNMHTDLIFPAVEAGKHVFVEKPVGMNGSEAYEIANAVNNAGVIFQTGYFMRSSGVNQKVRSLVQEGALGDITRLRLSNVHSGVIGGWFDTDWRWMTEPDKAGVGAFGDLGSHVFDLLLWFMEGDSPKACTGYVDSVIGRYPESDEYGEGMVTFDSGAVATVAAGWVDHANPNQIEISGTKGHLRVTNGNLYVRIPEMDLDASEPYTDLPESWKHPVEIFFDEVAGTNTAPLITADEAAAVNQLVTQIYNAHQNGSWIQL
jgi:predicted dehydrogenase